MIKALYFGLCFALVFLGVVVAIHVNFLIGVSISILFTVKFFLMKEGII
jgi:hypothetical protein